MCLKYSDKYFMDKNLLDIFYFSVTYTFFLRNMFSKAVSMFLKISSIWAWNVSYKFWFTPSPKNGYLQSAQLCLFVCLLFLKFQVNWTYFLVEMASTLWVWVCLFVLMYKKPWGYSIYRFNSIAFVIFFDTLTVNFLLKHYSIKKRNFSSYVCQCQPGNVS